MMVMMILLGKRMAEITPTGQEKGTVTWLGKVTSPVVRENLRILVPILMTILKMC